ncbi:MAG: septum formation family protein [Actinomycetota bacterium]
MTEPTNDSEHDPSAGPLGGAGDEPAPTGQSVPGIPAPPPAADEIPPPPMPGATAPPPPPPPGAAGGRPRVGIGADGSIQHTTAPEESWFSRIPLGVRIIAPIVIVFGVIGWWTSRGQTDAEDLGPGDCFAIPTADEFESVTDQSCDEPHEAEIVAIVQAPFGTAWPGTGDIDAIVASEDACFVVIAELTLVDENIPLDAELGFFFTDQSVWNGGDREVMCYVTAPAPLVGSVFPGG